MKKCKGLSGRLGILGLAGLMGIINAGCDAFDVSKGNEIVSASFQDVQNSEKSGERTVYGGVVIDKDINGDKIYDVSVEDNRRILTRVSRNFISESYIGIKYDSDNRTFRVEKIYNAKTPFFKRVYPIESKFPIIGLNKDKTAYDSFTGQDILDSEGKLMQRVFNYNLPGIKNFQRAEDFNQQGRMTKAVIREIDTGKIVYEITWNPEKKDYEVVLDNLKN